MGRLEEYMKPIQNRQKSGIADILGSSHSDYQQPAVGSSSRWLRTEQLNWKSTDTVECQPGMAECKCFPAAHFPCLRLINMYFLGKYPQPKTLWTDLCSLELLKNKQKKKQPFPGRCKIQPSRQSWLYWRKGWGVGWREDRSFCALWELHLHVGCPKSKTGATQKPQPP